MKKTIYMLLLFVLSNQIYAQNKQNEAIAAYQLAEENFEKGNYQTALDYLESAKKNFGKANSKMLYLQVYIENELYKNEQLSYNDILKTIASFEKAPDIKTFNNDKKLEISKLKLTLANIEKERAKIKKEKEEKEKKFDDYAYEGWPFNIDFQELQQKNKDSVLFVEKLRKFNVKNFNYVSYSSKKFALHMDYVYEIFFPPLSAPKTLEYTFSNSINGFLVRNNTVIGYRKAVLPKTTWYNVIDKKKSSEVYEDHLNFIDELIKEYSNNFGFMPEKKNIIGCTAYCWIRGDKTVTLYVLQWLKKNGYWEVGVVEEIKDESKNK